MILKAPFPYFGGKSRAAGLVWPRFGAVRNYVEPFFGSGAMLLARPNGWTGTETVNDADGLLCNFWRALRANPKLVAQHADWPVIENDLHARHAWLVQRKDSLQARLEGDPKFFDAQVAGWWVWGMSCWIAGGFCSGKGPWHRVKNEAGEWILSKGADHGSGTWRKRVHLGNAGQGVNRRIVHLLHQGRCVNQVAVSGRLVEWFQALADRLARVRVCCGDWNRVCTATPTVGQGLTAVFLDPPYADTAQRDPNIYRIDSKSIAHEVREWAIEHGDDPLMRIALCGYEGEHKMPRDWSCVPWKAGGGYASRAAGRGLANSHRERIWFSPNCIRMSSPVTGMRTEHDQAVLSLVNT